MSGHPTITVPTDIKAKFPSMPVADRSETRLKYSPTNHPRLLSPSQDAQAILDAMLRDKPLGIPERVAFDGGFQVAPDNRYHSHRVIELLISTARHYLDLAEKEPPLREYYSSVSIKIAEINLLYATTVRNYWDQQPDDMSNDRFPRGSNGPPGLFIAEDGRPVS